MGDAFRALCQIKIIFPDSPPGLAGHSLVIQHAGNKGTVIRKRIDSGETGIQHHGLNPQTVITNNMGQRETVSVYLPPSIVQLDTAPKRKILQRDPGAFTQQPGTESAPTHGNFGCLNADETHFGDALQHQAAARRRRIRRAD